MKKKLKWICAAGIVLLLLLIICSNKHRLPSRSNAGTHHTAESPVTPGISFSLESSSWETLSARAERIRLIAGSPGGKTEQFCRELAELIRRETGIPATAEKFKAALPPARWERELYFLVRRGTLPRRSEDECWEVRRLNPDTQVYGILYGLQLPSLLTGGYCGTATAGQSSPPAAVIEQFKPSLLTFLHQFAAPQALEVPDFELMETPEDPLPLNDLADSQLLLRGSSFYFENLELHLFRNRKFEQDRDVLEKYLEQRWGGVQTNQMNFRKIQFYNQQNYGESILLIPNRLPDNTANYGEQAPQYEYGILFFQHQTGGSSDSNPELIEEFRRDNPRLLLLCNGVRHLSAADRLALIQSLTTEADFSPEQWRRILEYVNFPNEPEAYQAEYRRLFEAISDRMLAKPPAQQLQPNLIQALLELTDNPQQVPLRTGLLKKLGDRFQVIDLDSMEDGKFTRQFSFSELSKPQWFELKIAGYQPVRFTLATIPANDGYYQIQLPFPTSLLQHQYKQEFSANGTWVPQDYSRKSNGKALFCQMHGWGQYRENHRSSPNSLSIAVSIHRETPEIMTLTIHSRLPELPPVNSPEAL